MSNPLEPDDSEIRRLVELFARRVVSHQAAIAAAPASWAPRSDYGNRLREPLPEEPGSVDQALDLVLGPLLEGGVNTTSPGNLSYVNGGGIFHASLAGLVASVTNRYVTYWGAAPGFAELESQVVRWFCDIIGYPTSAFGVLTTGGSLANLSALVTARRALLGEQFLDGVLYVSTEVHHSMEKAALIAGFPMANVRVVPSDSQFRIDLEALERAIASDRAAGRRPFFVVGNAGTTSSGAVDDLVSLRALTTRQGLWLHVDAAYGGFFMLTEAGRRVLAGLDLADSITLDPHKSLFLPYGSGCLLVREPAHLRAAHAVHSGYISQISEESAASGQIDFADLSAEMTREFRGLRVWLPLKVLGAAAFRHALEEKLELTRYAARTLVRDGFEVLAEPMLSIVAFRARRTGLDDAGNDRLNESILAFVNARGRVHLSSTTLSGQFALRICALSFRVHMTQISWCLEDLREGLAASVPLGC